MFPIESLGNIGTLQKIQEKLPSKTEKLEILLKKAKEELRSINPSIRLFYKNRPAVSLRWLAAAVRLRVSRLCALFVEGGEADLTPPNQNSTRGRQRRGGGVSASHRRFTGDGVTAAVGPCVTQDVLFAELHLCGTEGTRL